MEAVTRTDLEQVFNEADWPMDKAEVVNHVERTTDDRAIVRAVRALPLGIYARLEDVVSGVDTPDTPG